MSRKREVKRPRGRVGATTALPKWLTPRQIEEIEHYQKSGVAIDIDAMLLRFALSPSACTFR